MRNRQGKYDRCYVTLLYEGQWENNMRNGLGKSYYKNNNIKYKPIHDLRCKILNSWIEVGNTNSNER